VQIQPLPGFEIRKMGRLREWVVVASDDSTRNVIVTPDSVAGVLCDLATGGLREGFNGGYGHYWTIAEITE
jgi:hypothetical protein